MSRKRDKKPQRKRWVPLERGPMNPAYRRLLVEYGEDPDRVEVWGNDIYQVIVRKISTTDVASGDPTGDMLYLSIHNDDRTPIRDWRHLQQIKNEIAGEEREACELFPAESRLVDESNEYHLWVLPEGEKFPFGMEDRSIRSVAEIREFNKKERETKGGSAGRGRQREWQPGLTTGKAGG